jgi:alpha-L-fucosidase
MDKSFGFNQFSREQDYITAEEVKKIISEVFPKKGRLLLNAGPDSYGVIPEYQAEILKKVGNR